MLAKALRISAALALAAPFIARAADKPPAVGASAVPAAAEAPAPGYHLLHNYALGGDGFWDCLTLDPAARRLYVSHSTRVVVMNADDGSVAGEIPNTGGVHAIALAPDLGRGFTTNGRDTTVTIFDPATLKTLGTVKVTGVNPDAILYDASSRRLFTFNGRSSNMTAIDAASGKVLGTLDLAGKPEFAVTGGDGRVYVNIEDKSEIAVVDPVKLAVLARWPLAPAEEPSGLAVDRAHGRLFAACGNQMMAVVDMKGGHVVATPAIGKGPDGAEFDPDRGLAFSSNGEGTLTVIHEDDPDHYSVVENAATKRGARTMALDPTTHQIYLATAELGPAPAPTAEMPHPRPTIVPGSFVILVFGK